MGDAAHRAGRRAAKNTGVRAAAEIAGKLSTLVLFAAIGRELGEEGVGVLTLAFAYLGIVMTPIGFGTDPLLLREVARARERLVLLWDVVALKLVVAPVVLGAGLGAMWLLGYDAGTRAVLAVMAVGLLLDLLAKTCHAVFNATERGELLATTIVVQRLFTAGAGVAALVAGADLVVVAWVFTAGSAIHLALGVRLLVRHTELPPPRVEPRRWLDLSRRSAPFAVQDVFTVLLFKLDAVLLSVLVTEAAVGRYGAAYRLLEATMFVGFALNGAFAAMYTYLGHDTEPTVGAVFGRSLKVALLVLVPVAVVFGVLAEPLCALVYGGELRDAGGALRLLAPVVVLLGVVTLCTTLIVSRRSPRAMFRLTALAVVVNVALNLALVPAFEERGAAAAMLLTEVVLCALALRLALAATGPPPWLALLASPVLAGAAMAAAMLPLRDVLWLALPAGGAAFAAVAVLVERRVSPGDLAFVAGLVRRRARATA